MICFTNRMTKSSLDVNLAGILSIYDKKSKKFTIAEIKFYFSPFSQFYKYRV